MSVSTPYYSEVIENTGMRHSPVHSRGIAHQIAQKSTNKKPQNRTNQHGITEISHYLPLVVDRHAFVSLRYGHSHHRPAFDWVDRGLWR